MVKVGKQGTEESKGLSRPLFFLISHQVANSTMKPYRTWCEVLISFLLMKLRLAAQPIPTPEARGFSKKTLSSGLSRLEAQAAAENKIK